MRHDERSTRAGNAGTGSSSLSAADANVAGGLTALRGGVDYHSLRELVSIAQVLEIIGWRPVARSGPQLRGPCPIHRSSSEQSRSFSVNTEKNLFQCFGCGKKGNQLDLYVAVSGMPLFEAAVDLSHRLQLDAARIAKSIRKQI